MNQPAIGTVCVSRAGHDKGRAFLIVGVYDENHVLLSDGETRKLPKPKKKKLSHLHFDHVGGLLAPWAEGRAPQLLFPNATFVVGKAHWQRALRPHPRDRASFIPELPGLLESSGRLELVEGEVSQVLGDAVRFHHSDGHTPGLMLAEITGSQMVEGAAHGGIVFCADLIPGRPWVHVPITMGYDRNAELLIDEKRAFLEDKLTRNVQLFFTHDAGCAMAQVVRDEKGKFATTHAQAELVASELLG